MTSGKATQHTTATRLDAKLVSLLLLLLCLAFIGAYWGGVVVNVVNEPDEPGAASIEPEFYRFAKGHNYDFFQYYAAGHDWLAGLDPYRNHPGDPRAIPHPRHEDKTISGYIYPPTWLPVFGLFARLPYDDSRQVWAALTLALLGLGLGIAALCSPDRRLEVVAAGVLLSLASCPLLYHLHQGQADLIVSSLAAAGFVLYGRWRSWPTALLLAAAIALKLTPALLLLVMVLYYRDMRLLAKAAVAGAALVAASLPVVTPALYAEYLTQTLPTISTPVESIHNQSLARLWAGHTTVVTAIELAAVALLFLVAWLSGRQRRSPDLGTQPRPTDLESSAVLLFTVVVWLCVSPLSWQMGYVAVIIPLALVLSAGVPSGGRSAVIALGLAAVLMSWNTDLPRLPVLDSINLLGALLASVTLGLGYLPWRAGTAPARAGSCCAAGEPG